jgi:hypothetical protein
MHAVELTIRHRLRTRTYRRDLPATWNEVPEARRLRVLRWLLQYPGATGQVRALRDVLALPASVFKALDDAEVAALLAHCNAWMHVGVSASPRLEQFTHKGRTYYLPSAHGINLAAIEYPIADEAFMQFVRDQKPEAAHMLVATLCREQEPDEALRRRRGDQRVPLLSRFEAEARAKDLEGLDADVIVTVLLYFAGVKEFVHKSYGAVLFDAPEGDDESEEKPDPGLGWWGLYFQVATEGPFGDVERVYQTPFHDVCLYLVNEVKRQRERERHERLNRSDFGQNNP